MNDVETVLRTHLHDRLDLLEPSTLTAQQAVRRGQRAHRRRTAIVAAGAALVLVASGVTATALIRSSGGDTRESVTAAAGLSARSVTYAEQFRDGDFASIRKDMAPDVRELLPEQRLRSVWQLALDDLGPLVRIEPAVLDADSDATYLMPLHFARGQANMRVTYDESGAVIGVTILNAQVEKLDAVPPQLASAARQLVADLAAERYDSVRAHFDANMTSKFSTAALRAAWEQVGVHQHGGFVSAGGLSGTKVAGTTVVDVFCTMKKGELKVRMSFDGAGRISGLFLLEP